MPARARQLLTRHGWLIAIAFIYLYVFPYFPRIHSANELPRVYLVKAIVHDGTFAIDGGVRKWGATADVSPYGGHQYSNKAPGSSLLVVPFYAAVALVAGEPSLAVTLWLCRVIAGVLPALLFLALLSRFLARFTASQEIRRLVIVAYALGSMAMTYSVLYFAHQLAAALIAAAWIFAYDAIEQRATPRTMLLVGACAGAAVLTEYQAAFVGVPIAVFLIIGLVRTRSRREVVRALAFAAIGAAIPIAILLSYHAMCFGSPLRTGYDTSETFAHLHKQGFLGLSEFRPEAFWGSTFRADNGLFVLSPWLLLAIPGGVVLWRRGERATVLIAIAAAVIFILFVSSIAMWRAGWALGPRYITAMLPFLLPPVACALAAAHGSDATQDRAAFERWRWLVVGALCVPIMSAIIIYTTSLVTMPYWPDVYKNPLYEVAFRLLSDGAVAPNPLRAAGVTGIASVLPVLVCAAVLASWAIQRVAGWRGLAVACVGGAAIIGAFAFATPTGAHGDAAYHRTVYPAVAR